MFTEIQFLDIVNILIPCVTGIAGWFVGRKKQRNDFLKELQESVDLLAQKNKLQMEEILKLRDEVVILRSENAGLLKKVEDLNSKLQDVKTITRKS